jgi:hypothetical protein
VPLHIVAVQVQLPPEQFGVGWAQAVWFCQVPVALQVSGTLPLQFTCPGAHTPLQRPITQVWFTHALGVLHWPIVVHVCDAFPMHCVCEGPHTPPHALPTHVWFAAHAVDVPQLPMALHVCMAPRPTHCVLPGMHDPMHTPFTHAALPQFVIAPQLPLASHDWTALPWQRVSDGPHTPMQLPLMHVIMLQAMRGPQLPFEPQVC